MAERVHSHTDTNFAYLARTHSMADIDTLPRPPPAARVSPAAEALQHAFSTRNTQGLRLRAWERDELTCSIATQQARLAQAEADLAQLQRDFATHLDACKMLSERIATLEHADDTDKK